MIQIGRVEIRNPVVVAPMSGITDRPFRRLAAEMGAGLLCTEMASAIALVRQGPQTCELTRVWPDEHPISVQLMGREMSRLSAAEQGRLVWCGRAHAQFGALCRTGGNTLRFRLHERSQVKWRHRTAQRRQPPDSSLLPSVGQDRDGRLLRAASDESSRPSHYPFGQLASSYPTLGSA